MKIKRCPVLFHNVISAKFTGKSEDWYESAQGLRNAVIRNGLYGTGPIMYQVGETDTEAGKVDYTFYIPVSQPVVMKENEQYRFEETWLVQDSLVLRHADLDESMEESYELLRACAEANGLTLQEPFYNIYLDVFGGGVIDICAPIVGEES